MIRNRKSAFSVAASALMLAGLSSLATAAEPKTVAEGLDNPAGVAVQPKTGDVFVSTNKAVLRLAKANDYEKSVAIDGFASDIYGKGPKYEIGPLGLLFMNPRTLVVGGGDQVDGKEVVRFFKIPMKSKTQSVDDATNVVGPIEAGDDSEKGEGNFYDLVKIGPNIFVTCNGDDTKGWISRVKVKKGGEVGSLEPFIATKKELSVDAPTGATMNADKQLVVTQMGEITVPDDTLLTTYDPKSGKLLSSIKTGLSDVIGVAYSPKTGKLYGVDFSWYDTTKGGLFLLEPEGDEIKTTKIASLDKPTAIAFDEDGNAFVTLIGSSESGGGKVVMFEGL